MQKNNDLRDQSETILVS